MSEKKDGFSEVFMNVIFVGTMDSRRIVVILCVITVFLLIQLLVYFKWVCSPYTIISEIS